MNIAISSVWKICQNKMGSNKTPLKSMKFCWGLIEDINISDLFYKIQKFLRPPWALIITTNGINF